MGDLCENGETEKLRRLVLAQPRGAPGPALGAWQRGTLAEVQMPTTLNGFDPLSSDGLDTGAGSSSVYEDSTKRVVHNILRSYTGYFDLFSEAIQNSLDAVEIAQRARGPQYVPKLWITIDIPPARFRIVDNGSAMDMDEFKYCFRPNVSFKKAAGVQRGKRRRCNLPRLWLLLRLATE